MGAQENKEFWFKELEVDILTRAVFVKTGWVSLGKSLI